MNNPAQFGPSLLARHLEAALRDIESPKASVRQAAARDLARYIEGSHHESVVMRLTNAMQTDTNTDVRIAAMMALVDGGASDAVGALIEVARDAVPKLQQMALLALGELASPSSRDAVDVAQKATSSELPALRYQGLVTLRNLLQLSSLDIITEGTRDDDPEVRWVAVRLLEEFWSFGTISELSDIERHNTEQKVIVALAPRLRDTHDRVRVAAVLLMARLGVVEAIEMAAGFLSSRGPRLSREDEEVAIELAGDLRIMSARSALQRRAWPLLWETPLAWKARVALAQLGDERASAAILQDLQSKSPSTCLRAIEAAGRIRLESARPRLIAFLHNPELHDAQVVKTALERLGPHP